LPEETPATVAKKPVPKEVEDLAETVRRECRSFEDLLEKVRTLRTRPYSRVAAIVYKSSAPTLKEVCEKGPSEPRYSEIGILYEYVSRLGVCGEPEVTIYRAAREPIAPGDWVYLERSRAEDFAEYLGVKVFTKRVRPEDVVWAGTSPDEWFYVPRELQGYWKDLRDFWRSVTDPPGEHQEKKRKLEEIRRRLRELRRRIERWAMYKIADVSEMNYVYRAIGEILRELSKYNPDPEAVRLRSEAEELMRMAREKARELGVDLGDPVRPSPEFRARVEEYLRRIPRVYRIDWLRDRPFAARISFHREARDELLRALREIGARVVREIPVRPPMMLVEADFTGAKPPEAPKPRPKPPVPVEERLRRLKREFMQRIEAWATLYLRGERRRAFIADAERQWSEREYDIRVALEEGREDLAESIVTELLRDKARVLVSLSRKAREHPEISRLLPPEVARAPPAPPGLAGIPSLPPRVMKWARWLTKLETMTFAPRYRAPLAPRPSLVHPNPFIAEFPPMGERVNDEVVLHPATVAGLAKLADMAGVAIPRKTRWRVSELRMVLEEIYDRVSPNGREWISTLREALGI